MSHGALLSLAGFDPTSGAGVTLDTRVFAKAGYVGMGLITAITVQNTREVRDVHCLPAALVREQFRALDEDADIRGIKIGMLGCREHISTVASIGEAFKAAPVVVDPVLRSSSGACLLAPEAAADYMAALSGRISLLTPNLEEAAVITGSEVSTPGDMESAARQIFRDHRIPSLVKGGHLPGDVVDVLFDGNSLYVYERERSQGDVHGTGCLLSSLILCFLAGDIPLPEACQRAGIQTQQAIRNAAAAGRGQRLIVLD